MKQYKRQHSDTYSNSTDLYDEMDGRVVYAMQAQMVMQNPKIYKMRNYINMPLKLCIDTDTSNMWAYGVVVSSFDVVFTLPYFTRINEGVLLI